MDIILINVGFFIFWQFSPNLSSQRPPNVLIDVHWDYICYLEPKLKADNKMQALTLICNDGKSERSPTISGSCKNKNYSTLYVFFLKFIGAE